MARLNIEETIWSDPRFLKLCIKLGDELRAIGAVVMAWRLAQKHWCPKKAAVPESEWRLSGLPDAVIEVGLAEFSGDGVKLKGVEDAFSWYFDAVEAGRKGGQASARSRKPKRPLSKPEQPSSKSKRIEPSSSSSSSLSLSSSSSSESIGENEKQNPASDEGDAKPEVVNPIGRFIGTYVKAYQGRYGEGARPEIGGQVQGQIKKLLADTPLERACSLIQTYCQMEDPWFLTKAHDFGSFMANLNKVGLALDTGRVVTRSEIRQKEKTQGYRSQMERIQRGEL